MKHEVTIVLPTYNEGGNIKCLLKLIDNYVKIPYSVIIVDDNSYDLTAEIAKKYVTDTDSKHIRILQRKSKLGLGSAYCFALEHIDTEYVVIMDADLSHNPVYINALYSKIQDDYDIVVGSRYMENNHDSGVSGWSYRRKLTSHVANNLSRIFLGIHTQDCTNSYRMYRTHKLRELATKVNSRGYSFQLEAIFYAEQATFKIAEIPIIFYERVHGKSKLDISEVGLFLKSLLQLMVSGY